MSVYAFQANNIRGQQVSLEDYKGKVLVIVNTASKCGLTPQYSELQKLYETYKDRGLTVLGFPCNQFGEQEPGTNDEINTFCQLNYGVTFPMFDKIEVNGENKHPLYAYLTEQAPFEGIDPVTGGKLASHLERQGLLEGNEIKWNFTKFLIDRSGSVVKRIEPNVTPSQMASDIEALL